MATGEPQTPVESVPPAEPRTAEDPGLVPIFRAGFFSLLRWIGLGAGIFVCVLLLEMISLSGKTSGRVRIDSIKIRANRVIVTGSAMPGDVIEILTGNRQAGIEFADWRGRFSASLDLPPEVRSLWARAFSRDDAGSEIARTDAVPIPSDVASAIPPRITVAYCIEGSRQLWIAGYGPPGQAFDVRTDADPVWASVQVDANGTFDSLLTLPPGREPPAAVALATANRTTEPSAVAFVKPEALPLSRTAEIQIRRGDPGLVLRVALPSTHPYFALLEKGLLSAEDFGKASVGSFFGTGEARLASLRKSDGKGFVEIDNNWKVVPPRLFWRYWSVEGIGSFPLLTAQDRIVVHFQDLRPAWFGDLPPSTITDNTAAWQGPMAMEGFEIGFQLSDLVRAYGDVERLQSDRKKVEEERFSDFARHLGERGGATLVAILRQLILLIPFAGLVVVWRRGPSFGRPELWRGLVALALLMALWRIFSALQPALSWLGNQLFALPVARGQQVQWPEVGRQAFWITFAFFVATLPEVWPRFAGADPLFGAIPVRRVWYRRLGLGLRSAYLLLVSVFYLATAYGLLRPGDFFNLRHPLDGIVDALALPVCLCLAFLAFGFRALLMCASVLVVAVRQFMEESSARGLTLSPDRKWLAGLPLWVVILAAVVATLPFLLSRVRRLTRSYLDRRGALLLTAALVVSALALPHLPVRATMILAGSLLLYGFAGLLLRLLRGFLVEKRWVRAVEGRPWATRGVLAVLSLLVAWPLAGPANRLEPGQLQNLNQQIEDLFVYGLALGVVLLLFRDTRPSSSPIVSRETLVLGIYLFAVLLINSYSTWLLVPVPVLVGFLLASTWLFRPEGDVERLRNVPAEKRLRQRRLIQDVVDAGLAGAQFSAIQKSLTGKLNSAELSPGDYESKREEYRSYLEQKLELETVAKGVRSQEAVFAVGGPELRDNVESALKTGAVLASGPFLIALYQFLPYSRVSYPYPLMTLLSFIVSAAASWLLYAFFFGFYYAYLRGATGLTKGIHLFVALALPFAVYRLLNAESLTDMRPFLLWATQLFLFCSLLGLISVDYRLLRANGFRLRDLTAVHNVPALSAYASTVVAALIPTVTALVTGQFKEIVKFFLETVLGVSAGA